MLKILAHTGSPVTPHDLATSWDLGNGALISLALIGVLAVTGHRRASRRSSHDSGAIVRLLVGLSLIGLALVSPLDAGSQSLASAHMVQHLILMVVAAPLIASGNPVDLVMSGLPRDMRRAVGSARRQLRLTPSTTARFANVAVVVPAFIATTWVWHSSSFYERALQSAPTHITEHAMFVVTSVAFWSMIGRARTARAGSGFRTTTAGPAVLILFGVMMSNVFLGALMTFARTPWYPSYSETTTAFGLSPLADQQLAGVLMWVPPSIVYLAAAMAAIVTLLNSEDTPESPASAGVRPTTSES